ncbi:MAG: hypothetical protein BLM47_02615 [Candidatus Reconcilbacillus cellulovorans]|uniref:Uncharacterized protein n=1 Tax=Candidatus Reconcilbacillus cellulovorans TaxID=1906605 RepID=A0A2A6E2W4_9BACL|nr:MAG: hypothetical protein BLM47_02615 [Candidatus Reconcilbacillus cellulovorans]
MGKWLLTIACLIGSAVLTRWLPFSPYFRNVNTLVHEFGHAVVTLLFRGEVHEIALFVDHSGVTRSTVGGVYGGVAVALAGYATASLFSVYLFWARRRGLERQALAAMLSVAVVCLTVFVRNPYGMLWTAGFSGLTALALAVGGWPARLYLLFVAFLSLEESVSSAATVWIVALTEPEKAGDAAILAERTGISAAWWGFGFTAFSLLCARSAVGHFFGGWGGRKRQRHERN